MIHAVLANQCLQLHDLLARQFREPRVPELDIERVDALPVNPLPVQTYFDAQSISDAIRARPAAHLARFNELKYIPLRRFGSLPGNDSRTRHVLLKGLSELPEVRAVLKNDDGLVRFDAHHGQPRIAKFVGNHVGGGFFRQRHAKDQVWREPVDRRNPPGFGFDLVNFVQKYFAKSRALTACRSWRAESGTFSAGRVFLHPHQRQMRMPLVFRMVRHVIGRDSFRSVEASFSRRRRRQPFVSAGARCFL